MEINIAFTFDRRVLFGAAMSIKSLFDAANSETTYTVRIIHSDLTDADTMRLKSLADGTRHTVVFHKVNPSIFLGLPTNNGSWTEIVYYRFAIPEIVDIDKIIYSDIDVFFRQDLSELFSTTLDSCEFGAVRAERNTPQNTGHKYFPENTNEFVYWSGLLLLDCKKMRETRFLERVVDTARKFGKRLRLFDLDAMNLTSQKIKALPLKYVGLETLVEYGEISNCREYRFLKNVYSDDELEYARTNPAIVHYAGELGKPWQRPYNPEYWDICAAKIPYSLKRKTFRDLRKTLLCSPQKRAVLKRLFVK